VGLLAGAAMLGGLAIFFLELPALQRPVVSYALNGLDARMSAGLWNRLERDALVFDPVAYRAPALLGRFTDSSTTWYATNQPGMLSTRRPTRSGCAQRGFPTPIWTAAISRPCRSRSSRPGARAA
jgi:hypothetical protein